MPKRETCGFCVGHWHRGGSLLHPFDAAGVAGVGPFGPQGVGLGWVNGPFLHRGFNVVPMQAHLHMRRKHVTHFGV